MTPEPTDITEAMQERRWYFHSYREAVGRSGAAYGAVRSPDNRWFIERWMPDKTKQRLFGCPDFEAVQKAQDYCVKHDNEVAIALIKMIENGDFDSMENLRARAIEWGELPKRKMRLTLEVEVIMRGTDEQIAYYVRTALRSASHVTGAKVTYIEGPNLREPQPAIQEPTNV